MREAHLELVAEVAGTPEAESLAAVLTLGHDAQVFAAAVVLAARIGQRRLQQRVHGPDRLRLARHVPHAVQRLDRRLACNTKHVSTIGFQNDTKSTID